MTKLMISSAQIVEKEQQITDKQAEIDQKQAEYDDRWAKYKEQVVSMQMLDQGGGIALLSTAENIYQLLTFDQVLQDISDANTQACEDLEQQGIELTNERTQLEEAKASLEADEEELQNQKANWTANPGAGQQHSGPGCQHLRRRSAGAGSGRSKSDKQAEFDKAADEYDAYLKSLIAQTQRNYANAPISCSLNFICRCRAISISPASMAAAATRALTLPRPAAPTSALWQAALSPCPAGTTAMATMS